MAQKTQKAPTLYDLDDLRRLVDCRKVGEALRLNYKTQKGDKWVAFCPAHDDKTTGRPNLVVDKKGAHCFRCGFRADGVGLVEKVNGVTKGEAIRYLADMVGLQPTSGGKPATGRRPGRLARAAQTQPAKGAPLPEGENHNRALVRNSTKGSPSVDAILTQPLTPEDQVKKTVILPSDYPGPVVGQWRRLDDGRIEVEATLRDLRIMVALKDLVKPEGSGLTLRVRIFQALLANTVPAGQTKPGQWLTQKKGILPATMTDFGVAWLPDPKEADRRLKADFDIADLNGLGLLDKKGNLRFGRYRLLFPFWVKTEDGRYPVFIQGRDPSATGKQLRFMNPASTVPCFYNVDALGRARAAGDPVFICEGVTDTLTLTQAGYQAVGIIGTQGMKPDWVKLFAGLTVFLAFDGDDPGREASAKVARLFTDQGLHAPKAIPIPEGQDVTDYFMKGAA